MALSISTTFQNSQKLVGALYKKNYKENTVQLTTSYFVFPLPLFLLKRFFDLAVPVLNFFATLCTDASSSSLSNSNDLFFLSFISRSSCG